MRVIRMISMIRQVGNALTLVILMTGLIWLVGAALGVFAFMGMHK